MNDQTTPDNQALLTEAELGALMQRKAAIQANLKANAAAAGTYDTTSSVACPGCGCGCGMGSNAPTAEKSRLFKPALAVLVITAVALLLWGA